MKVSRIKLGFGLALSVGLVLLFTLLSARQAAAAPGRMRALDDQVDGDTITPSQTVGGTWGPGLITATADVNIRPGVIITVAPGTTIQISTTDNLNTGVDAARIEFIVESGAELRINGPVTFTSQSAFPAPADWHGVRYLDGSRGQVDGATIEYGVHALTLDTANPVTVANSELRYNRHTPALDQDAYGAGLVILQGDHLISHTNIHDNAIEGTGNDAQVYGGGVYVAAGAPQFHYCRIYANTATSNDSFGGGGGVAILDGSGPSIRFSQVSTNTLVTASDLASGGGVGIYGDTRTVIRDSFITDNVNNATQSAGGGGIGFASYARAVLIEGNVIARNEANIGYSEGGAIDAWHNNVFTASNNLMYGNVAKSRGGAMLINGDLAAGDVNVINNTIVNNISREGGGLYRQRNGAVFNNIIVDNTAPQGSGIFVRNPDSGSAGYNDVWDNNFENYNVTPPVTDLSVDPLFVGAGDVAQRYHVRQGSPVIDAAGYAGTGVPDEDFDAQIRPLAAGRDMGFDELVPFTYIMAVDPVEASGNAALAFTILITNPDPFSAIVAGQVFDALPANAIYSTTPPTCNLGACRYDGAADAILWDGDVPPGQALNLRYTALVGSGLDDGTAISNSARISVGVVYAWTNVVTTTIYDPAFTLSKSVAGTPIAGLPLTYTIHVTNASSRVGATNVVVTDALPGGTQYVSGGTKVGDTIRWTLPNIPAAGDAEVSYVVRACRSTTNTWYRVADSDQGVGSDWGPPLPTGVTPPAIDASFDFFPGEAGPGDTVYFTDTSSTTGGPIVGWAWDFGDGFGSSSTQFPAYAYSAAGSFTVSLTVTDVCGYDASFAWPDAVTVCEVARILDLESNGPLLWEQTTHFSATVQGSAPFSFTWDFGGAGTRGGTDTHPTFVYDVPGTYTVSLQVENGCGSDAQAILVTVQAPDIDVLPLSIEATLNPTQTTTRTLTIANLGNAPLTWRLEYPPAEWLSASPVKEDVPVGHPPDRVSLTLDGSGMMSGTYTTTLEITSNDWDERQIDVPVTLRVVSETLSPDIDTSPLAVKATLNSGDSTSRTVTVANLGNGLLLWELAEEPPVDWLNALPVGDDVPAGRPPDKVTLTFDAIGLSSGTYSTTLEITSNDPDEPQIDISALLTVTTECIPVSGADIAFDPAAPQVGQVVRFTGTVEAGSPPLTYTWDLGDGNISIGATTIHSYSTAWVYTVRLTATSGCDGSFDVDEVQVPVAAREREEFYLYIPYAVVGKPRRYLFLPLLLRDH